MSELPTQEEMAAEYKRANEQAEAARAARRNSLPNILRQHAFNDATNNVIWVLRCEKCGDIQTRKLR